jgi:hypothetical protein
MITGHGSGFTPAGLERKHWSTAEPIRRVFRKSFHAAGLPYFRPHSFRNTLVQLGERACTTPEEFKAWSQNLGHENVLTTFTSYGAVAAHRQATLIRGLGSSLDKPVDETFESRLLRLEAALRGGVRQVDSPAGRPIPAM